MQPTIEIKHTTDATNNRNKAHNRCSPLFLLVATSVVCFISIVGYICCVLYFYCWLHLLCALFLLLAASVVCFISIVGCICCVLYFYCWLEIKHTTDAANNRNKAHNRCSQQ
jgi:hypothetical protein